MPDELSDKDHGVADAALTLHFTQDEYADVVEVL